MRIGCPASAPSPEEIAGPEHADDGFFSGVRQHRQPDGALLDIHDAVARFPLGEDHRQRRVFGDFPGNSRRIEKRLRIECRRAGLAGISCGGVAWGLSSHIIAQDVPRCEIELALFGGFAAPDEAGQHHADRRDQENVKAASHRKRADRSEHPERHENERNRRQIPSRSVGIRTSTRCRESPPTSTRMAATTKILRRVRPVVRGAARLPCRPAFWEPVVDEWFWWHAADYSGSPAGRSVLFGTAHGRAPARNLRV